MKFKVGDKIECLKTCEEYTKGRVYEVRYVSSTGHIIFTVLDDIGGKKNGWYAEYFKLAKPKCINIPTEDV